MAISSEYLDYILDLLSPLDGITSRRMFGGCGLYKDHVFFALISDDTLYFKVTEADTRETYQKACSTPFSYKKQGKDVTLSSYWRVPAEWLEDQEILLDYAEQSYAQTIRNPNRK
ncbi:MAG: TfoX/Sxy family protein [Pseudomonadota bacterium]|jgi:DNA transformation protein|nr:TfoX family protein [Pseudomonadota bacterium]QKK04765.1 MAG: TfoX/Sxy family protein [Pseudomonadota bacterium]|tara:strand:+ start:835 stop:1179 length:345 start_codon:yes stop_codon:yes gene_type:complete